MKPGDIISRKDLAIVRPGGGLAPKYLDMLIGKRLSRPLKSGEIVTLEAMLG
jgi:sialic acid synthase SpsE